jgi:hypothetical protein
MEYDLLVTSAEYFPLAFRPVKDVNLLYLKNLYCFTDRTNPTVECPADQYKTGISRFTSFTGLKAKGKYSADVTNKSYSIRFKYVSLNGFTCQDLMSGIKRIRYSISSGA